MLECTFPTDQEMGSVCISKCVDDVFVPLRASYVNLYKWPESDAEFVSRRTGSSLSTGKTRNRVVIDGLSGRQMYLRSYKFTVRKESVPQKCFERVKERVGYTRRNKRSNINGGRKRKCCIIVLGKVKKKMMNCAALFSMFNRFFLSCTS